MHSEQLKVSLLLMRVTVFVVFLVWTLDKFMNVEHTTKVFQHFYFLPAFGANISYAIGAAELVIILGFLSGFKKFFTYGFVLITHFISTVSCYQIYASPWAMPNMLFWAAFPMLAACYALFVLRDQDTLFVIGK